MTITGKYFCLCFWYNFSTTGNKSEGFIETHTKMNDTGDSYENLSRRTSRHNNDEMKLYEEMMAERMLCK
jgi:hypothetical protein